MNDRSSLKYDSLGSLLEEFRSQIPRALIDDSGWERVEALTSRLPGYTADTRFGFEFDLCDATSAADFCAPVSPGSRLATFYEDLHGESAFNLAGPNFGSFLAQQRADPRSFLARTGATIILEYDLAVLPPGQHGPPGVFITNRQLPEGPSAHIHDELAGLITALESAAGWEQGTVNRSQMERVWAAVAGSGKVNHAAVMPGRTPRAVRLIISGVGHGDVAGMLERLQWGGDPSLVAATLADLAGLVSPRAGISIDVVPQGVAPRLGLELTCPVEQPRTDPGEWKALANRLADNEWCLPAKAEGLVDWLGIETVFGEGGLYKVVQTINHIKLVIHQDTVGVKGYGAIDVLWSA